MAFENLEGVLTSSGQLLTVSRNLPDWLDYTPSDSYMVSFGVNPSPSANGAPTKSIQTASRDAQLLYDAVVDSKAIPKENAITLTSVNTACTIDGMHSAFIQQAEKIQSPKGLLVCTYSGSAVKVSDKEWSLVPIDYDKENPLTHITAGSLVQWLAKTQVKQVLFLLDCSFADELATKLTSLVNPGMIHKCMVLTTYASTEAPCITEALGHSFLSYFTAWAFTTAHFTPGHLPLSEIHEKTRESCTALSILTVAYDTAKQELKPLVVSPRHRCIQVLGRVKQILGIDGGSDKTDADIRRFEFITRCYKQDKRKLCPRMHEKVDAWLETIQESPDGPLTQLQMQDLLNNEVLLTVVYSVVFSVVSTEAALEKQVLSDPNFLIFAFLTVIATVDRYREVPAEIVRSGWDFLRQQVIVENSVQCKNINQLFENAVYDSDANGK